MNKETVVTQPSKHPPEPEGPREASFHPSAESILAAHGAIHRLKARYFQCVDEKNWRELTELFTTDAVLSVPAWPTPKSRDQAMAAYAETMANNESVHTATMPVVDLTSAATATGTWQMQDRLYELVDKETGRYTVMQGYGRYLEEYRIVDGEWRISSLTLLRTRRDRIETIIKL